jgi:predicted lipoprotein with Yx(FWY)xxD motif
MRYAQRLGMASALALAAFAVSHPVAADEYGPSKGMTLYTYDQDKAGTSTCVDQCAVNWPPVMATKTDKPVGDLTIIKRPDGTLQWADNGKPLYTFIKDKKPGDMTGDKMKDVWHVVKEE